MRNYKDVLLCDEDTIKSYTNINDNVAGEYILPALYMAQHQDLEECLGSALVRKLQELVATGRIDDTEYEDYKTLLDDNVSDFLAYATIVRLIPVVSFKIGNMGAVRTEDDKVVSMSYSEVFNLKDYYQHQADYLLHRLQRFVLANYSKYPELGKYKSIDDLQSNLYSASNIGIWLGGARNKSTLVKQSLKDKYDFPTTNKE